MEHILLFIARGFIFQSKNFKNHSRAPTVKHMLLQISKRRGVKKPSWGAHSKAYVSSYFNRLFTKKISLERLCRRIYTLFNFEKVYFPMQKFKNHSMMLTEELMLLQIKKKGEIWKKNLAGAPTMSLCFFICWKGDL